MTDRRSSSPSLSTILRWVDPAATRERRRQARENFGRTTPVPGPGEIDPTLPTGVAPTPRAGADAKHDGVASPWAAELGAALDAGSLPSADAPPVTPDEPATVGRRRRANVVVGAVLGLSVAALAIAMPLALGWRPAGNAGAIGNDAGALPSASASAAPAAITLDATAASAPSASATASATLASSPDAGAERPHAAGKRAPGASEDPYATAGAAPVKTAAPAVTEAPAVTPPAPAPSMAPQAPTAVPAPTNEPDPSQGLPYRKKNN